MVYYCRMGEIPPKRHIASRKKDGSIHQEHLMGNLGFTGIQSLLYHLHPPTALKGVERIKEFAWEADPDPCLRLRHFRTHRLAAPGKSPVLDRIPLLFNDDLALSLAHPAKGSHEFYRNGQGDELIFVTRGQGILESQMGELDFGPGDYLVIPKGIIHRFSMGAKDALFYILESRSHIRTPA
ncbi:MAG: cupin domain-containing protein, partial [Desulfovibrionales bacterium]|nr:cupin domain-containing protein [Desulfovibrionales bacterium]